MRQREKELPFFGDIFFFVQSQKLRQPANPIQNNGMESDDSNTLLRAQE
jgi:hypothetical protein